MILIDDLIKELSEIRNVNGNVPVFMKEVSWGNLAVQRELEHRRGQLVITSLWEVQSQKGKPITVSTVSNPPVVVFEGVDTLAKAIGLVQKHNDQLKMAAPTAPVPSAPVEGSKPS